MSAVIADVKPPFVVGHFDDVEPETYHGIEALSSTGCKHLLRSPAHYRYNKDNPTAPTAAMNLGTAVHAAILEPELYEKGFAVVPTDAPKRPTAAQVGAAKPSDKGLFSIAWWADFDAKNEGKIIVEAADANKLHWMVESVRRHESASWLLSEGKSEYSMFWLDKTYDDEGVPCKARFDWFRPDKIAVDLKTCQDASAEGFGRQVASMSYHLQAAHYWVGCEHVLNESPKSWTWIAVESEAPYGCAVYVATSDILMSGMRLQRAALERYRLGLKTGYWPNYSGKVLPLQMPGWALKERIIL
jgi:exodeoxyribonuclease VIII